MRTRQFLVLAIGCIYSGGSVTYSAPQQLDSGISVMSQDNRFTAIYDPDQLEIRSTRSKESHKIDGVPPVYALQWTRDSKTLIIVHHLAGGSGVIFAHLGETGWCHFGVVPPGEYDRVGVIRIEPHNADVLISWKAMKVTKRSVFYYLCKARMKPAKQALSNVQVEEISVETFDSLHVVGEN
jgi:hypothetical protein